MHLYIINRSLSRFAEGNTSNISDNKYNFEQTNYNIVNAKQINQDYKINLDALNMKLPYFEIFQQFKNKNNFLFENANTTESLQK